MDQVINVEMYQNMIRAFKDQHPKYETNCTLSAYEVAGLIEDKRPLYVNRGGIFG